MSGRDLGPRGRQEQTTEAFEVLEGLLYSTSWVQGEVITGLEAGKWLDQIYLLKWHSGCLKETGDEKNRMQVGSWEELMGFFWCIRSEGWGKVRNQEILLRVRFEKQDEWMGWEDRARFIQRSYKWFEMFTNRAIKAMREVLVPITFLTSLLEIF